MASVRIHFDSLYATNSKFRDYLTSNRLFNRAVTVIMIKEAATKAMDKTTADAAEDDIYDCVVALRRDKGREQGLKKDL
jgi:hypothetical protein